jgi:hypothetical protein
MKARFICCMMLVLLVCACVSAGTTLREKLGQMVMITV